MWCIYRIRLHCSTEFKKHHMQLWECQYHICFKNSKLIVQISATYKEKEEYDQRTSAVQVSERWQTPQDKAQRTYKWGWYKDLNNSRNSQQKGKMILIKQSSLNGRKIVRIWSLLLITDASQTNEDIGAYRISREEQEQHVQKRG